MHAGAFSSHLADSPTSARFISPTVTMPPRVPVRQGRCGSGGLVKFDFLGLRNLTIIELALECVRRLTGERRI